jgi:hypothetical protein
MIKQVASYNTSLFLRLFYRTHKHYNLIKIEIILKVIIKPGKEPWVWIERESNLK